MITIIEARRKRQIRDFITFPFTLYKDNPYWVPPLINDEIRSFDRKNKIFKTVDVSFYLAYKNEQIVGRIAAIINWTEVNELKKKKVRFGWFDTIDDIEISRQLIAKVEETGRKHGLEYIEGPVGFSNMDKAGMLTEGFDQTATMIGLYNYAYYPEHMEKLGFTKQAEWLEYKISYDDVKLEKIHELATLIENRYKVKSFNFNTTEEILPYVNPMFELLNKSYAGLQSFVPIEEFQIEHYKKKYIRFIHPDFVKCVISEEGKLLAFAVTMPSLSKAFQKANGKLFPLGFWHILQAMKKSTHAEFYLIGIDPEYQNKGLPALIMRDLYETFTKKGIRSLETNPQLEENVKIQQLWRNFNPSIHKRRKTFKKNI